MRVYELIADRRAREGGSELGQQLAWRLRVLNEAGAPTDLRHPAIQDAFREVLEAYTLDEFDIELSPLHDCVATTADDGQVAFWGWLTDGHRDVAELSRRLMLGRRFAYHGLLRVSDGFRGRRIAVRLLDRALALYDELGPEYIELHAGLSVGRWYWARCGFSFVRDSDRREVQAWAQRVVDQFGGGLDVSQLAKPWQIAELGERVSTSALKI